LHRWIAANRCGPSSRDCGWRCGEVRYLFIQGGLFHAFWNRREKEGLQDFALEVRGCFRLIELFELARAARETESADGFAAEDSFFSFFAAAKRLALSPESK